MFCPKCGTKNDDGAIFCGSCGARMTEEAAEVVAEATSTVAEAKEAAQEVASKVQDTVSEAAVKSEEKAEEVKDAAPKAPANGNSNVLKWLIPAIAGAFALIVLIVVFVVAGVKASDYKAVAKKYTQAYVSGNLDKAYSYINVEKSDFLTLEAYVSVNSGKILNEVKEIQVLDSLSYDTMKDKNLKPVAVTYKTKLDQIGYLSFVLEKTKKKTMLVFPKYMISSENLVSSDIYIRVPNSSALYINGVEVTAAYITTEMGDSQTYTYYKIPKLFNGINNFKVTGSNIEDYETTQTISYDEQTVYFNISDMAMKETLVSELEEKAVSDLEAIKEAGVNNNSFSAIESLASIKYQSNASSNYTTYVTKKLHSSTKDVSAIKLTNVKAEIKSKNYSTNSDGYQQVIVYLSYSMNGTYESKSSFSSTTTKKDGSGSTTSSYITYVFEEGSWRISNFNLNLNIY